MSIYGLFVGINYPHTSAELYGCVNDAKDMESKFRNVLSQWDVLLDNEAKAETVLSALLGYVKDLKARDTLIFTFSGHGTWVPDENGDEPDGRDECLCPIDYKRDLIYDDQLDEIFSKRARGSRIVFISDTCHSGTIFRMAGDPIKGRAIKFLPPEEVLKDKKKKLSKALKLSEKAHDPNQSEVLIQHMRTNAPKSGLIHLSGCLDHEYSYDGVFNGRPNGALTYNFLKAFDLDDGCSYKQIYEKVRVQLPSYQYPQQPRLNATTADKKRIAFR